MMMRMWLLALALTALSGCENVSLNFVFPPIDGGDSGSDAGDGGTPMGQPNEGDILLCVVNEASVPIAYRVSVIGLEPVSDDAAVGETVCFDAPCGTAVGIDQIVSSTFTNEGGAQFLDDAVPCGQILVLRVQPNGAVNAFINNPAGG